MAGITTETGVNHFHLAMSQLFSLERGGIEKAEKRGVHHQKFNGGGWDRHAGDIPPHTGYIGMCRLLGLIFESLRP